MTLNISIAAIALALLGCSPNEQQVVAENVENAAAVAQYKALLQPCREKGRVAKSYAIYAECADEVDAHICRESGYRCKDGGAK